ncbi:hypothetical protein SAMN05216386_2855 [Nitrosospira briensis]|uniref:Uncharacterized protein n=1 Tax=Nitrosospira briensis TaxID=35799 RepID=A0A1I5F2L0_9PROT|nr:hypothetical protein SAMN05216386_2855 [Nitrosospira briensis]
MQEERTPKSLALENLNQRSKQSKEGQSGNGRGGESLFENGLPLR